MDLLETFFERCRKKPVRIVFPEGQDARILTAASKAAAMGIARPIVVGEPSEVTALAEQNSIPMAGVAVASISDRDRLGRYAADYAGSRNLREAIADKVVRKPFAFAGMMVKTGDGMVGGATCATATVIQAAGVTIGFRAGMSTPSSFFIMVIPQFLDERDKVVIFADCAVNISPTPRQLAEIGVMSGLNARALFGIEPKVAFLSFSTHGSASHADVDKVVEAVRLARELNPPFEVEGELQGDAALVPRVAAKKVKNARTTVAGRANVLVFPDIDAGNIAYKLVQYLGGATALGPILQGFAKPVSDLSRGASADDILGVTAITAVQAHGDE